MTANAQYFATVADLIADAKSPGADDARLYQAIAEASEFIAKDIGWFIPVTATRYFKAPEAVSTLFIKPLLEVTSITNDTDALTGSDYLLKPDGAHWAYGPYSSIVADPDSNLLYTWSDLVNGVTIVGKWGKYNRTASTGATVADTTQQSDSQTTLKVSNGAAVSPGMVLLIGTEQELVTGWGDPTTSVTTLNGAVAATDETITLTNASLVNVGEVLRVDFEQWYVRDRRTSNNTISVIRGWNGTARTTHTTSTAVDVYRTVTVERGVNGTTAAAHANGVSISRHVVPADVNGLCRQIATLIVNKALSGYQGRVGNEQTGVVFYNDAYPRFEIERVRKAYSLKGWEA